MQHTEKRPGAGEYLRAKHFTDMVKRSGFLTPEEKRSLFHRAVHGDVNGAWAEYDKIATREARV